MMEDKIAKHLLEIGAVFLRPNNPFLWASGIQSPIYCDNRLTLSFPQQREDIENRLAEMVTTHFPDCEMLMGTSTAGIPHAAFMAERLHLPMGYVRSSSKDHGRENCIEGKCEKGTKVVVVEDLISTAGSVSNVVETLRAAGINVLGIVAIFDYGMQKAKERFANLNLPYFTASNYDCLLEVAVRENYIKPENVKALLAFRDNPSSQEWMSLL